MHPMNIQMFEISDFERRLRPAVNQQVALPLRDLLLRSSIGRLIDSSFSTRPLRSPLLTTTMQGERPIPDLSTFDPADHSWWQWREMGSPDDPYNQIPKLSPEDSLYKEYLDITEAGYESILKVHDCFF
jgi:hypothetical protein